MHVADLVRVVLRLFEQVLKTGGVRVTSRHMNVPVGAPFSQIALHVFHFVVDAREQVFMVVPNDFIYWGHA